jgi:hypothetical protein
MHKTQHDSSADSDHHMTTTVDVSKWFSDMFAAFQIKLAARHR